MDGIINVLVNGYSIVKDHNCAGAQFEGNSTKLRIVFSEDWKKYVKTVTFWNALGNEPVKISLGESMAEDVLEENPSVYLVAIPAEAMTEAGILPFTIDGYLDGVRKRTAETSLKVLPSRKSDKQDPSPTLAEQLQKQIDTVCIKCIEVYQDEVDNLMKEGVYKISQEPNNGDLTLFDTPFNPYYIVVSKYKIDEYGEPTICQIKFERGEIHRRFYNSPFDGYYQYSGWTPWEDITKQFLRDHCIELGEGSIIIDYSEQGNPEIILDGYEREITVVDGNGNEHRLTQKADKSWVRKEYESQYLRFSSIINNNTLIKNSSGGFMAGAANYVGSGGAIGNNAFAISGGAVGNGASAKVGGAVGASAEAFNGGAIGSGAKAEDGGAVGSGATTLNGFAGGRSARTVAGGDPIDAIQLGTGTNSNERTLQVYDYQLMDAEGNIPAERLENTVGTLETEIDALENDMEIMGDKLTEKADKEQWRLINEVTLEEDAVLEFTADKDGNAFNLKKFKVLVSIPQLETQSQVWLSFHNGVQYYLAVYSENIPVGSSRAVSIVGELTYAWQFATCYSKSGLNNSGTVTTFPRGTRYNGEITEPLCKIKVALNPGMSTPLPAGSKIKFWGVDV